MVLGQVGSERRPHVAGVAEAMQQHHGRPFAADAHVDFRAFHGDVLGAERSGEWRDAGMGGQA
ncbi:hypothetical protein D3C76_1753350 [compost metagenome]